jgi:hypothetical protein
MKENIEKIIQLMAEDEALRNAVSQQAQEAILNPDFPDAEKDEVVESAIETIYRIGQNRTTYTAIIDADKAKREAKNAKQRESRRLIHSETVYKAK